MSKEQSYGIIPLRQEHGQWMVLLVCHRAGHWSFPKGHADGKETPQETAKRELQEETGLHLSRFLSSTPLLESYSFSHQQRKVEKTVSYFLAEVNGKVKLQEEEISNSRWVEIDQAQSYVTFNEGKQLCAKVRELLKPL